MDIKQIEIQVEDIKAGRRNCGESCPAATALSRSYGGRWFVAIWFVRNLDTGEFYSLDPEGSAWVYHYDRGNRMHPAKFGIKQDPMAMLGRRDIKMVKGKWESV